MVLEKLRKIVFFILWLILENPIIPMTAFFIFMIWAIITNIKIYLKFKKLNKAIKNNPTNEVVREYIKLVKKKMFAPHYPKEWNALRQAYYCVKELDSIDYELRLEFCHALQKKGTSGVHPPRQYNQQIREEKIKQAGEEGEKKVSYALKWLDKNRFKVFSNCKLSDGGEPQEFDSIVIGDYAIFNIEVKNYVGDLTIDSEGNWYRIIDGKKIGTENAVFQVKRHHTVLNNILDGRLPIVDLVVWTNVESIIEGTQHSPVKILKVDQLMYFIENYQSERKLSKDEIDFAIKRIKDGMKLKIA